MRAFSAILALTIFFGAVSVSVLLFLFQMGFFKGVL